MKLGTNIKSQQMMWGEKNHNSSTFFAKLSPFEILSMKFVSTLPLKNRQRYVHETGYKNKLVSDNVQRKGTVTPPTIFVKLCPFEIFLMKNLVCSITLILSRIFS